MIATSKRYKIVRSLITVLLLAFLALIAVSQPANNQSSPKTQIVLLGTGTPSPDPDRSGPATAIVVNGTPYLIDFGPGVVRRAAAAYQKGVKGLSVVNLRIAFVTHLHSDHTAQTSLRCFTNVTLKKESS